MNDDRRILLCNTSSARVTWTVQPAGDPALVVTQLSRQYGWISVPFADSYVISCDSLQATAKNPGVVAAFTGSEIVICTPA